MKITMDTTFQEIRNGIQSGEFKENVEYMKDKLKSNKHGKKPAFQFLMSLILGSTSFDGDSNGLVRKYNEWFYSSKSSQKNNSTLLQNVMCGFLGRPKGKNTVSKELDEGIRQFSETNLSSTLKDIYDRKIDITKEPKLATMYKFPLFTTLSRDELNKRLENINAAIEELCQSNGGNEMPTQTQPTAPAKTNDPTVTAYIAECIENSRKKNIIFTGAPGTGKTYSVEKYVNEQNSEQLDSICSYSSWYFKFVQFHGSYDYTDFVEGLRPIERGEQMVFVRMDGTFKALCREAAEAEKENGEEAPIYYFVIDEINRAELSKVFGELMYCFEKRGSDHRVQTQYHNLPTYGETENDIEKLDNDIFKDGFYVPENVVIIGTMNDIDRNVETFDFALRRRFDWIPIKANDFMETSLRSMLNDEKVSKDLAQRAIRMNEVISGESDKRFGLNEDYHIGPAYFKDYDKAKSMGKNLDDIWKRNIEPILREYLRGKNGVDKFINDCHKALMNDQSGDKDTNEPQTTAEDEE